MHNPIAQRVVCSSATRVLPAPTVDTTDTGGTPDDHIHWCRTHVVFDDTSPDVRATMIALCAAGVGCVAYCGEDLTDTTFIGDEHSDMPECPVCREWVL